ncbi:class I SAM-dependent methyltransferase [Methermicoccus shengliensis]|uniref:tRNA(Phe) (4-demethylwyosine(37)-C(7)) aminocarboxypropyltransferase n=1 Tax=Methermicoccus shengliensis TaxID=660064 RepID=A0A832RXU2_9EURY|nr:class I SAM-dependent methyltransferase family protein [Methermicoccus shengliensis]KUK04781.1 MAG: Methyltransferase [Euryarchaeota archaeon 55_53]KUK29497.1 MAG: Methyltransferase [Methanosarcinales archeaon 56_1174]MDI3487698.1 tRNA wybutosine-synthesizing protein 2 [Methanosarcinales archaeon]MDN5295538.1 tRNA wybutosine-synthesizing protein 2 [Methanosarcinales archaeon]HIH70299.1 class I SAM-dependent methyltransferase family protein [Methermicoccus shengliensis]
MRDLMDVLAHLSPEERRLLPRRWQIVGDIMVVKLKEPLLSRRREIAKALLELHPMCRCVVLDFGIEGQLRTPKREVVYPEGASSYTVHRENGVLYPMDVCRVMFSKGNQFERMRMASVGHDEVVVDMFAGIGYFTLPCAVWASPRRVYAMELNPVAHSYLCEGITLNRVEDRVVPMLGSCLELEPPEPADRVIMGLIGDFSVVGHPVGYLRRAIGLLDGSGIIHYHESVPSVLSPQRPFEHIERAAALEGVSSEVMGMRRVKKFSPGVEHVVVDVKIF